MILHRTLGQTEPVRDLLVRRAGPEQRQDLGSPAQSSARQLADDERVAFDGPLFEKGSKPGFAASEVLPGDAATSSLGANATTERARPRPAS